MDASPPSHRRPRGEACGGSATRDIQPAFWFVASVPLVRVLRSLSRYGRGARRRIALLATEFSILVGVGLGATAAIAHFPNFLPNHQWKILALSGVGCLFGIAAAIGVWLAHERVRRMLHRPVTDASLRELLETRDTLQNLLLFLGGVVGLAILAASAERNAIAAYSDLTKQKDPGSFPQEYVLVYGIYFSLLLGLVYVPAHLTMRAVGHRMRDQFFPLPSPADPSWQDVCGKRKTFDEVLSLNVGPAASFKAGFAILTPLLGSLTGLLLGH